jgi:hypothetical protein
MLVTVPRADKTGLTSMALIELIEGK